MSHATILAQAEKARLAALNAYDILDTPCEEAFDRVTRLVIRVFGVPISTVTLIDGHRQWFKSQQGLMCGETDRGASFCNVAMRRPEPLVISDTWSDPLFASHPLVVGAPFLRFYAGIPLRASDGCAIGVLCAQDTKPRNFAPDDLNILRDLARIVEAELELRIVATRDSLTGSMSRRAFRSEATRAIKLARRHGHPLSCLMVDLDHFKRINDHHGHAMGDRVLVEVARTCQMVLRDTDLVGRLGGEEFGIVLLHTDQSNAFETAERLRNAVSLLSTVVPTGPLSISASFGIAALGPDTPDLDALLERADEALYRAKAGGRNCSVLAQKSVAVEAVVGKRRVLKAGQITFNGGRSVIDCTVRALSEDEAELNVISTADIPKTFKLRIAADNFSKACQVRSRRDRHVDVIFRTAI